jgi:predicted  nucleic acid-binding Zn-ribbon protein
VVAKAPQINAAIDQIGAGAPVPAARAMDASREAQLRDLQERFARYESKIVPLEKGYAQLKQRHADLLKAYSELRKAHVRESTSEVSVAEAHPVAAP